jgi:hypothetical protein
LLRSFLGRKEFLDVYAVILSILMLAFSAIHLQDKFFFVVKGPAADATDAPQP